jgi:hypothetical protein
MTVPEKGLRIWLTILEYSWRTCGLDDTLGLRLATRVATGDRVALIHVR